MLALLRRAGLGLRVGAVLLALAPAFAHAQDTTRVKPDTIRTRRDSARVAPPRPDTVKVAIPAPADTAAADSARRARAADSVRAAAARRAADTLKAPIAHAEVPATVGIAQPYRWDREAIFASGALTLTDLLRDVPGFNDIRSGWLLSPHHATYFGNFRGVRVFYDGVELDALDQRDNGILDLSFIALWTLEEVVVEQGAGELRVYLRSWRVRRTTPNTRVDVATGDLDTNLYRGFFGQRYPNGMSLQFIAQQFGTQDPREGGDGDQLGLFGRVGWARGKWSVDAVFDRIHRSRSEQARRDPILGELDTERPTLPSLDANRNVAYARLGYGDPDAGPWLQLIAGNQSFRGSAQDASSTTGIGGIDTGTGTTIDTASAKADTTTSGMQYVVAGGLSRWGVRLSATGRYRSSPAARYFSPSARAAFERGRLAASIFAERRAEDSVTYADAAVRFTPLSFLSLAGYASHTGGSDLTPASNALRGEVGVRLGRLWVIGGLVTRDTTSIPAPIVFDTAFKPVTEGRTTAALGAIRGPLWKAISVDVTALRYGTTGFYRPQLAVRGEVYASTSWLGKFPSGNFHIKAGASYEYRTESRFPTSADEVLTAPGYRIGSTILEIRLLDAVLSWQFRNVLGYPHQQVPGFFLPRAVNFYGVRWDFFN